MPFPIDILPKSKLLTKNIPIAPAMIDANNTLIFVQTIPRILILPIFVINTTISTMQVAV